MRRRIINESALPFWTIILTLVVLALMCLVKAAQAETWTMPVESLRAAGGPIMKKQSGWFRPEIFNGSEICDAEMRPKTSDPLKYLNRFFSKRTIHIPRSSKNLESLNSKSLDEGEYPLEIVWIGQRGQVIKTETIWVVPPESSLAGLANVFVIGHENAVIYLNPPPICDSKPPWLRPGHRRYRR